MVVELKIKKKNPWAGLLKYKGCCDYIAPYWTRSGMRYTGLTPEDEESRKIISTLMTFRMIELSQLIQRKNEQLK